MCGIVGAVQRPDPTLASALAGATRALAHRGPDGEGVQVIETGLPGWALGLGVRRLAILDPSPAGSQPMQDPGTGNWIVHNGEVYNFRDIRKELEGAGCRFRSQSDTEVLLQSYAVWDVRCVDRWRGMFATAIWDARRHRLLLFRDRLGVKPLYYLASANAFSFASEVRALLKAGWVPPRLDATAFESLLSFGAVQEPLTIVAGVRALPPAHYLVWEDGRFELKPYWQPWGDNHKPPTPVTALPEAIAQAARLRLVSDVPVGVLLSGGIDSSSLVALLHTLPEGRLRTFSVVFPPEDSGDAACARRVAQQFSTDHSEVAIGDRELVEQVSRAITAMDQPTVDGINTYVVCSAVRAAGLKVAISGLGGDELFGGYATFRRVPQLARLESFCGPLPRWGRRALATMSQALPASAEAKHKLRAWIAGDAPFAHPLFLLRALFTPEQVARLLTPRAIQELDYAECGRALQILLTAVRELDPFARIAWLELRGYTLNTLLRDADQMGMAQGVEVRTPFLDHCLVEAALSLPAQARVPGRLPKPLLVSALPRPLPEEIVRRRKIGFTLPFDRWLRGSLRPEVESALLQPSAPLDGVLREEAVAQVWRGFLAGRLSWSRPWMLYVLKRWVEASGLAA